MDPCDTFRLHSFPEFSEECVPGFVRKNLDCDRFQRVDFQTIRPGGRDSDAEQKRVEIERIEQEAYSRGFQDGEKAGMEAEVGKVTPVICNFNQALQKLELVKKDLYVSAEERTIELALAIAKKIVGLEISVNKDAVMRIVRQAIQKVVDKEDIRIRVNPEDFEFVREAKDQLADLVENLNQITVVADETIAFGGCIVESKMGDVDARIEKQFQFIDDLFRSELNKAKKGE